MASFEATEKYFTRRERAILLARSKARLTLVFGEEAINEERLKIPLEARVRFARSIAHYNPPAVYEIGCGEDAVPSLVLARSKKNAHALDINPFIIHRAEELADRLLERGDVKPMYSVADFYEWKKRVQLPRGAWVMAYNPGYEKLADDLIGWCIENQCPIALVPSDPPLPVMLSREYDFRENTQRYMVTLEEAGYTAKRTEIIEQRKFGIIARPSK